MPRFVNGLRHLEMILVKELFFYDQGLFEDVFRLLVRPPDQ